jgi:transcriptional regulator with XRE-family HTH domain
LAARTGVAQPTIARIEVGHETPRLDTLERLCQACGHRLSLDPKGGESIDRSSIRELRGLSPADRLRRAAADHEGLRRLEHAARQRR